MSTSLTDALKQLDLQPGEARLVTVNGYQVEVRRLPAVEESDYADQVMLQPWVWFPDLPGGVVVKARPGPIDLPDRPHIPTDDEL